MPSSINARVGATVPINVYALVPVDDMMQAFIYHHLVPAENLKVAVLPRPAPKPPATKAVEKLKPKS